MKKKQLNEEKLAEKKKKEKLDKLLKMKQSQYKEIPVKEKEDIKREYEFAKVRREMTEETIKSLEEMAPLDYLSILNTETKEKLIGLCLNKKLMEGFDEDKETMFEEEELEDEDEEMSPEEGISLDEIDD